MFQAWFRIRVPSDKRSEILDVLRGLKEPTEASSGCRAWQVFQDADDESALTFLISWATRKGLEEHFRSPRFRRLLPYIELSVVPPEVEIRSCERIGGMEIMVAALAAEAP